MKHLRKFDSQEEYETDNIDYDSTQLDHKVSLVGKDLRYFDRSEPFYVEAVTDIVIKSTGNVYPKYSFNGEEWVTGTHLNNNIPAGGRVYFKPTPPLNLSVEGDYNIGGYLDPDFLNYITNPVTLSGNLISARNLIVDFQRYLDTSKLTFLKGKTTLIEGPEVITCYGESYPNILELDNWFSGCTALQKAPVIIIKKSYVTQTYYFYMSNLYKNCINLTSEIVIKIEEVASGYDIKCDNWLSNVPLGTLVLNPYLYTELKSKSHIPAGWKIKLSDMDSSVKYLNFIIGSTTYYADEGMTWEEWVSSKYNTLGLKVSGTNIVNDSGTLYLGETAVLSTDLIHCIIGTDYTINIPTAE